MFKSTNIRTVYKISALIRITIAVLIMALVSAPGIMTKVNAEANSSGHNISCGNDSICKGIEANEFDLIIYSSLGSEVVILYNKNKTGEIIPKVPEPYYSKVKGTVKDAIYYLSRHSDYSGFRFKKARKSTGFFKTQVIDGVYIAVPEYRSSSDNRPPEYSFSEKNGKLNVSIRPIVHMTGN